MGWARDNTPKQRYPLVESRFRAQVANEPLSCRAKVVQDRLFAPRVLHCSLEQLFWNVYKPVCEDCRTGF